jgi:hypothetical protein
MEEIKQDNTAYISDKTNMLQMRCFCCYNSCFRRSVVIVVMSCFRRSVVIVVMWSAAGCGPLGGSGVKKLASSSETSPQPVWVVVIAPA